ncbi:Protein Smg [Candidatus Erwinia haradaeae]|uniref:Protein Smg, partial n=1 Tax=Candidatus Erwinia haradaeae TaxID=1922217 RepID=A0A451DM26_9GAMM|nr:DUF494 family protein [Candidatus Erwinia haradaeae]VFP87779.1 Protein Smg [Candidatus Erwinia haradaeae]
MFLSSNPLSMRVYTIAEKQLLDVHCRGFMLFLEQIHVLNLETREIVIERIMALDTLDLQIEDLKWVVLMVLFNTPGCESSYKKMEELIFDLNERVVH